MILNWLKSKTRCPFAWRRGSSLSKSTSFPLPDECGRGIGISRGRHNPRIIQGRPCARFSLRIPRSLRVPVE
jgi:hypothetical protein